MFEAKHAYLPLPLLLFLPLSLEDVIALPPRALERERERIEILIFTPLFATSLPPLSTLKTHLSAIMEISTLCKLQPRLPPSESPPLF